MDRTVEMHETKQIGEITDEGINVLTYVNATARFQITESNTGSVGAHQLTVKDLDLSADKEVTLVIASTPQTVSLQLGSSVNVDLDADGVHDLRVTFASLVVNRVELTLKKVTRAQAVVPVTALATETPSAAVPVVVRAVCPSSLFTRDLRVGMSGEDVRALQRYLNAQGFPLAVSGVGSAGRETSYFGPITRMALMKMQTASRLASSGLLDRATRAFLGCVSQPPVTSSSAAAIFARNLSVGMTGEDVRALQRFLNANGFVVATNGAGAKGNESTYFGPRTRDAVQRFQKAKAITPADGYVGPSTRGALN